MGGKLDELMVCFSFFSLFDFFAFFAIFAVFAIFAMFAMFAIFKGFVFFRVLDTFGIFGAFGVFAILFFWAFDCVFFMFGSNAVGNFSESVVSVVFGVKVFRRKLAVIIFLLMYGFLVLVMGEKGVKFNKRCGDVVTVFSSFPVFFGQNFDDDDGGDFSATIFFLFSFFFFVFILFF